MASITVVNECVGMARPARVRRVSALQRYRNRLLLSGAFLAVSAAAFPQGAQAACNGAAPPYTITAQNTTVDLDTDCAGVGGPATVTGNIVTTDNVGIFDGAGGDQDWAITVNTGITVSAATNALSYNSPNASLDNFGMITSSEDAVFVSAGGTITNELGATISSTIDNAIGIYGSTGTVNNYGTLNAGTTGNGIFFNAITAPATVTNTGDINADAEAVRVSGSTATVTNSGIITSTDNTTIYLLDGGFVNNSGTLDADIYAVRVDSATGTVINSGMMTSQNTAAIRLAAGGSVTNNVGGSITGHRDGILILGATGTVTNHGMITSNTDESGVQLQSGGTVTNTGTIFGDAEGVLIENATGTVTNSGEIAGDDNFGVILRAGGSVTNLAGGTIYGGGGLNGVNIRGATGTVDNAGEIYGDDDAGVELTVGGTIINRSGGLIQGDSDQAITVTGGPANVINAGTIHSINAGDQTGDTVLFAAFDDRFEIQTGSSVTNDDAGTVNPGIVQAGGGNDTLAFGGTGEGDFDLGDIDTGANTQQYRNFEEFEVVGGEWSFSGATTVAFTQTGGTLKGTGTFGGLTINDGVLAPGNSIGTMTVNGAFALNSGAVYEVEVDAKGRSDKVVVKGTVNLTGATLRVLAANGNYKTKTNYRIIDNDGNDKVKGTFGTVTTNLAFLTPSVAYDGGTGNDVVLTLMRTVVPSNGGGGGGGTGFLSFCSVAQTKNQCNVAEALDLFPADNELFRAVLTQTEDGARAAFDALDGEIHASVAGSLADDSRYVREAILGRLMQANYTGGSNPQMASLAAAGPQVASIDARAMALGYGDEGKTASLPASQPLAFWTHAYGAWGDFGGNRNAASADRDLGGFVSGMDAQLAGSWRAGLATGASFSNVDVDARYSSADVESYTLGGYLGGMAGAFALRGGGMWAWNDIETSRAVVFPNFYERQKASYDADTGQLFGEIAFPTQMFGMALEPFGGLAYVSIDGGNFKEHGGKLASLRGSADEDVGYSTLGLRAAQTMMWGAMQVTPHLSAAWQHAFDDVTPDAALAFASTGTGFNVAGVPLAEDSALIDAGLDFAMGENTTAGVSYTGQYGDGVIDNGVKGRFTWLF